MGLARLLILAEERLLGFDVVRGLPEILGLGCWLQLPGDCFKLRGHAIRLLH